MKIAGKAILIVLACLVIIQALETGKFLEEPCGIIPIRRFKIVGGHNAPLGTTPWMAMVMGEEGFRCGATLITNRFVLTAAHCLGNGDLKVRLGQYNRDAEAQEYDVDAVFVHKDYTFERHDISLLRLATRVQYTDHISPICLLLDPLFRNLEDHMLKFRTYGWGRTQSGAPSQILQKTTLYNIPRSECSRQFANLLIDRDHICANRANASTCNGDSGGPLTAIVTYDHTQTVFQFGIVSFGQDICRKATVFTNIMAHLDWIVNTVRRGENM